MGVRFVIAAMLLLSPALHAKVRNVSHLLLGEPMRSTEYRRIVGGVPSNITKYPFMVSVMRHWSHACGGTLFRPDAVITAAHCCFFTWAYENQGLYVKFPVESLSVLIGSTVSKPTFGRSTIREVKEIIPHEKFNFEDMKNDIALLKLSSPVALSASVSLVALRPADAPRPRDGALCAAVGWGFSRRMNASQQVHTHAELVLHEVVLPVYPLTKCQEAFNIASDQNICTLGEDKDACVGDSGGPLLCAGRQAAIISYGRGCASPDFPGVCQRVDIHEAWLKAAVLHRELPSTPRPFTAKATPPAPAPAPASAPRAAEGASARLRPHPATLLLLLLVLLLPLRLRPGNDDPMVDIHKNERHHCGGTLLTIDVVLTASHCVYKRHLYDSQRRYVAHSPRKFRVLLGSTFSRIRNDGKPTVRNVSYIHAHPHFKFRNMQNDIALLKLSKPVNLSHDIQLVDILPYDPLPGTICTVLGWGISHRFGARDEVTGTFEDQLHVVDLSIISLDDCQRTMPMVTNQHLCTYTISKDACLGDSGGPLLCQGKQAGITSFGRGCAAPGFPGVFQKVYVHDEWSPLVGRSAHDRGRAMPGPRSRARRSVLSAMLVAMAALPLPLPA